MKAEIACELCGGAAAVRCEPDAAYLCWTCDARVHGANFLVARHVRRILFAECDGGAAVDDGADLGTESESSSCCSSSGDSSGGGISSGKPVRSLRRNLGAISEAVVVSWCRRLGLGLEECFPAVEAFTVGERRMRGAPRRAVAAAAAWFAAGKAGGPATLRRLEACSGVPGKLILAMEERLSRAMRRSHIGDEAEGWAESVDPACSLTS